VTTSKSHTAEALESTSPLASLRPQDSHVWLSPIFMTPTGRLLLHCVLDTCVHPLGATSLCTPLSVFYYHCVLDTCVHILGAASLRAPPIDCYRQLCPRHKHTHGNEIKQKNNEGSSLGPVKPPLQKFPQEKKTFDQKKRGSELPRSFSRFIQPKITKLRRPHLQVYRSTASEPRADSDRKNSISVEFLRL
jgi:hypothetical protein